MSGAPLSEEAARGLRDFLGFDRPAAPSIEGMRLGRYRVGAVIGRGGMGVVHRGVDEELRRDVAIKVLAGPASENVVERFQREARAAARLDHPHIVKTYDVGESEGIRYLVMALVDGTPLSEHPPARGRADMPVRLALFAKVARAIGHAHVNGVIHRDLKPGNILVDPAGEPHVADFGLARVSGEDLALTRSNTAIGTPTYMSPEQVRGDAAALDARTDVYSIGVMIYEAVTGLPPYRGMTSMEVYDRILKGDAAPPRRFNPLVPADVETVCLKAMSHEPAERYASADDLAEDLERCLRGEPVLARPVSAPARALKWLRRNPALAGAAALAAAGILGGGLFGGIQLFRAAGSERARREETERRLALERESRRMTDLLLRVQEARRSRDVPIEDWPAHRGEVEAIVAELDAALSAAPASATGRYARGLALVLLDRDEEAEREFGVVVGAQGAPAESSGARIERAKLLLRRLSEFRQPNSPDHLKELRADAEELRRRATGDLSGVRAGESLLQADLLAAHLGYVFRWLEYLWGIEQHDLEGLAAERRAVLERCLAAIGRGGRTQEFELIAAGLRESEGYQVELMEADRGDRALAPYEAAWKHADSAVRQAPNWAEAYCVRGRIASRIASELGRLGRAAEELPWRTRALDDVGRSVQLNPGYAAAWYLRGNIHFLAQDAERAEPDYSRAFELAPWNHAARKRRGFARLALGRLREGAADLEAALKAVPAWAAELDPILADVRRRISERER